MNYRILLLISTATALLNIRTCHAQFQSNADEAFRISSETHRPVLLVFAGSDWCVPCMRFERKILSETTFLDFASQNLIVLKAEFPQRKQLPASLQKQNDALAEKYNPEGIFPYVLLLGPEKKVMSFISYIDQSPLEFISELQSHLVK
jgi:thiamine biosynthesis lipoprotein